MTAPAPVPDPDLPAALRAALVDVAAALTEELDPYPGGPDLRELADGLYERAEQLRRQHTDRPADSRAR